MNQQIQSLLASLPNLSHADYFATLAIIKDLYLKHQENTPPHLNFRQIHTWDSQKADTDYQALLTQYQGNFKKAALVYFKTHLQGTMVKSHLGMVILNSQSKGKITHLARRENISKTIPRIPEILIYGEVGGRTELNKERDDSFVAFYEFSKTLEFADRLILARIKVGQRQDGEYAGYYIGAEQLDSMADLKTKIPFVMSDGISCIAKSKLTSWADQYQHDTKTPTQSPSNVKLNQLTSMAEQAPAFGVLNGIDGIKAQNANVVNAIFDKIGHDEEHSQVVFEVILDSLQVVVMDKATGKEVLDIDMDNQSDPPFDRQDIVLPIICIS